MDAKRVKHILDGVKDGAIPVEAALEQLARLPFADIGLAVVDHHRSLRTGFPEVVLGESKTAAQIAAIVTELRRGKGNVLVTRVSPDQADAVRAAVPDMEHLPEARALVLRQTQVPRTGHGPIVVVTAGTSDMGVAEEAALVAELAGNEVVRMFDVGVAGIHRLFHRLDDLRRASVIVVVAGMEGALASVVGGLVSCPVIAVPTSVGYGASFGGVAALLGMLSTCAAGVTVVNIDNGFGAGYAAALVNRVGRAQGAG
jgi:pyridinium-3,5-biscarboxylic acid mononucleotide synthase